MLDTLSGKSRMDLESKDHNEEHVPAKLLVYELVELLDHSTTQCLFLKNGNDNFYPDFVYLRTEFEDW